MLLRRPDPSLYHRDPNAHRAPVQLRYLGTAGFVIEGLGHTLVLDPFVTRPSLWTTLARPLVPDEALIRRLIPRADDVLIGHAHHDHVLDGPSVCLQTGARFLGSPAACHVARAAGVPEAQIRPTQGREDIAAGPATLRALPSLHGKIYGRVPLPGDITAPPAWPPRYRALRHGLVLNWHITLGGLKIVHIDSADFLDAELEGLEADVLCLCAIGRQSRPKYVETAARLLRPKVIVACHWDWFFDPYGQPMRLLPGVDLEGFSREITAVGAQPIILDQDGVLGLG